MLADYEWIDPKDASSKAKAAATRALEIDESLAEAQRKCSMTEACWWL
jgi:hypothetical protein